MIKVFVVLTSFLYFGDCHTSPDKPCIQRDKAYNQDLMKSVKDNNIEGVKTALQKGADPNTANKYGNTVLMWASFEGYEEIVKELLKAGADVNRRDVYHKSALMFARQKKHYAIEQILLSAGAKEFPKIQTTRPGGWGRF
ncbi:MAG: ankyrin repeat domain-containing protein [Spirochaetota bacterium]